MSDQPFKELVLMNQADYHRLTERASQQIIPPTHLPSAGGHQTNAQNPSFATASDAVDGSIGSVSGGTVNNIELAAPGSKVVIESPNSKPVPSISASTKKLPQNTAVPAATAAAADAASAVDAAVGGDTTLPSQYVQAQPTMRDASTSSLPPSILHSSSQTTYPKVFSKGVQVKGVGQKGVSTQTSPNKSVTFGTQTFSPSSHDQATQLPSGSLSRGSSTLHPSREIPRAIRRMPADTGRTHHAVPSRRPPPISTTGQNLEMPEALGLRYSPMDVPVKIEELDEDPLYHHQELIQEPYLVELPDDEDENMTPVDPAVTTGQFIPITHEQVGVVSEPPTGEQSQAGKIKRAGNRRTSVFKSKAVSSPTLAENPKRKRGRPRKKNLSAEEEEKLKQHVQERLQTLRGKSAKKRTSSSSGSSVSEPSIRGSPKSPGRPRVLTASRTRKRVRGSRTTDPDVVSERISVPYKTRKTSGKLPGPRRRHYDEWIQ